MAEIRPVRQLGEVTDLHGVRVSVGVDHSAVTIGALPAGAMMDREQRTAFYRLLFDASAAAGQWEAQNRQEETADGTGHAGHTGS